MAKKSAKKPAAKPTGSAKTKKPVAKTQTKSFKPVAEPVKAAKQTKVKSSKSFSAKSAKTQAKKTAPARGKTVTPKKKTGQKSFVPIAKKSVTASAKRPLPSVKSSQKKSSKPAPKPVVKTQGRSTASASKAPVPVSKAPVPVSKAPVPVSKAPVPVSKAPVPVSKAPVPVSKAPVPVSKAPTKVIKPEQKPSRIPSPTAQPVPLPKIKKSLLDAAPDIVIKQAYNPSKMPLFYKKQQQRLVELRSVLYDTMDGMAKETLRARPEGSDASVGGMHMGDAGSDAYDRDFALSMLAKEQDALYEITEALGRLERGVYGICEISGTKIPEERLEALPYTRYSRETQEQIERDNMGVRFRRPVVRSVFGLDDASEDDDDEEGEAPKESNTQESSLDFMKE
ncbi:MAG: TraR/DksA C4-type zinc finger protein [Roseimicrobium sp.]